VAVCAVFVQDDDGGVGGVEGVYGLVSGGGVLYSMHA
jgi:hypothetical protein